MAIKRLLGGTPEGDNTLYMFLLNVLTPAETPLFDPWQLRVLDSGFLVVDSALDVPQPGAQDVNTEVFQWFSRRFAS